VHGNASDPVRSAAPSANPPNASMGLYIFDNGAVGTVTASRKWEPGEGPNPSLVSRLMPPQARLRPGLAV